MNKILFSLVTLLTTLPILSAQTPDSQESQPGRQPVIVTSDLSVKEKVSSLRLAIHAGGAFRPGKIEAGTDPGGPLTRKNSAGATPPEQT